MCQHFLVARGVYFHDYASCHTLHGACRVKSLSIYDQHSQIRQKSSSHLKIPGARRATRSAFHTDIPQTLGIAVQNLFPGLPGTRGFCTPEVCFQRITGIGETEKAFVSPVSRSDQCAANLQPFP